VHAPAGDPVDTADGDFSESLPLVSIPGYGPHLQFTATYDAQLAQAEAASGGPGPGALGWGWSDGAEMSLSTHTSTGIVTIDQENGSEVTYQPASSWPDGGCTSGSTTECYVPTSSIVTATLKEDLFNDSYAFTRSDGTTYGFDSSGQLTSVTDRNGAALTLSRGVAPGSGACPSSSGVASCTLETDASGRTLAIEEDSAGQIVGLVDPMGRTWSFSYDTSGNLTSITDPMSRVTSFTYDTTESGASATLAHDLLSVTKPGAQPGGPDAGKAETIAYDTTPTDVTFGWVTSTTDPLGNETTFSYDSPMTSPTGTTVVTDPMGNETQYTYDQGVLTQMVTAYGTSAAATTTYQRDPATLLPTVITNPDGDVTTNSYDRSGNLLSTTNGNGDLRTYAYNAFGEVTCATTPEAASDCGDLTPPAAVPAGESTLTPPSSTPPAGVTYTQYDTHGNQIWQTTGAYDPGSNTPDHTDTTYRLYNGQSVTSGSTQDACTTSAPAAELPCATIDGNANLTQLGYDTQGDVTSSATPDGNGSEVATTTSTYDADGELTSRTAPDGNLSGANAADDTTAITYDHDGEKTSVTQGTSGANVTPRTTNYSYDANGNLTKTAQSTGVQLVGVTEVQDLGNYDAEDLHYPTGTKAGDFAVLVVATENNSTSEVTSTPTGFSPYATYNSGPQTYDNLTYVDTHTVTAGETDVTVDFNGYAGKVLFLAVYRGVNTSNPIDAASETSYGGTSVTAPSLSTSAAGDQMVFVGTGMNQGNPGNGPTWTVPATTTAAVQTTDIDYLSGVVADGPGPDPAGTSASYTATTSSAGQLIGVLLALEPASGDTTTTQSATYDAAGHQLTSTNADGASTYASYNGDGQQASVSEPIQLVGSNWDGNWWNDYLSLSYPAQTVPGDVVLLATTLPYGESVTAPSGYGEVTSDDSCQTTGCVQTVLFSHTVGLGDTGVVLDYSTSDEKTAILLVYRGLSAATPIDTTSAGAASASTSTSVTVPALSAAQPGEHLVLFAGAIVASGGAAGTWTAPAGMTNLGQVTDTSAMSTLAADLGPLPAGSTGAQTASISTQGPLAGILVALEPDVTTMTYDALGDRTSLTQPAPAGQFGTETTSYRFDGAGLLQQVSAPPASVDTGAPDQVTTYTYDQAGQETSFTTGSGTQAASTTSYCYDPNGDRTAVVAPDANTQGVVSCATSSPWQTTSPFQTASSYDSMGELVARTRPATAAAPGCQRTTYTYDADGNRLSATDPNGVVETRTYTPLGLLASTSYSDSTHGVTYTYDASGNRTQMTDASGTTTYGYDPFGELTSQTDGAGKTVSYSYDTLGDQTSVTYPLPSPSWASSDTVSYAYDQAGELTAMADFGGNTIGIENSPEGQPVAVTLGVSSDTVLIGYDDQQNPSSITLYDTASSATLLGFSYAATPAGTIAKETATPAAPTTPATYDYNAQRQVTSMTPGTQSTLSYAYDPSGNLTTLPTGTTGTYDDSGELTSSVLSSTTTDYTYDAAGNRLGATQGSTTLASATYDGANQLTSYQDPAAAMTSATYDGDGLRTADSVTPSGGNPANQGFVWDTTGATPELLMDGTNAYLYGNGTTPIEQVNLSSGAVSYLVSDALGSVRGVVSQSGSLSASTSYDAWGNPLTSGGLSAETPFGFAGGYTDPNGLVYLLHRYYDPATGQFLSVDPAVAETGQPYAYAGNDPVNGSDPSGLCDSNPFSGGFWSSGNCLSGLVGGPDGGGGESVGGVVKSVAGLAAGVGVLTAVGVTTAATFGADIPVLASIGTGTTITAGAAGAGDTIVMTAGYEVTAANAGWALSVLGSGTQTALDCINALNATCAWDVATLGWSIGTGVPGAPGSDLVRAFLGLAGLVPSPFDSNSACRQS
jgi:RHS repeat-associated protein